MTNLALLLEQDLELWPVDSFFEDFEEHLLCLGTIGIRAFTDDLKVFHIREFLKGKEERQGPFLFSDYPRIEQTFRNEKIRILSKAAALQKASRTPNNP